VTVSGLIPTGTASGVAFFGDDNNITGSSNFVFDNANTGIYLYRSATDRLEIRPDSVGSYSNVYNIYAGFGTNREVMIQPANRLLISSLDSSTRGRIRLGDQLAYYGEMTATNFGNLTLKAFRDNGQTSLNLIGGTAAGSTYGIQSQSFHRMQKDLRVDGHGDFNSGIEVISAVSTDIPLLVQGAASQSANLQEWQDSAGNTYSAISDVGNLIINTGVDIQIYNTGTDGDTDYERLRFYTESDTFWITSEGGGVGSQQSIRIGDSTEYIQISTNGLLIRANNQAKASFTNTIDFEDTIRPGDTNQHDIGSTARVWNNLYVNSGIFYSGVQFPDGVTQTVAYTGQTGDWKVGVSGLTDTITSGETVTFTGVGTSNVFYDDSTNTLTISGQAGAGMTSWDLSVTGDSTTISDGETVTFSGQDAITTTRDGNTVIISGAGGGTTYTADSGVELDGTTFIMGGTGQLDQLDVTNIDSTAVPLTVQGAASQSANLQEWQDSTATTKALVTNAGHISVPRGTDCEFFGDTSNIAQGSPNDWLVVRLLNLLLLVQIYL